MSSIHDAIVNAAQGALEQYLAADLVEKLTNDIIARARPEIETALSACVGFELGRAAGRGKASAPARAGRRRKESQSDDGCPDPSDSSDNQSDSQADGDSDDVAHGADALV